ncbi:hypothetical protein COL26b_008018 [Colletotrichum chrysophilum]|uniref:uncharacterized protein n=1 Tax=Colletotrichum chrysophilum TaxID=1836956 RepID=UPI002300D7C3|nr:uncharacterized protein COL26b_008018 [Colletotrichum chrysophilum]KAJ0373818.1 hypothetical protein COL26b_008018 [Colletotrichum chrysophilum]
MANVDDHDAIKELARVWVFWVLPFEERQSRLWSGYGVDAEDNKDGTVEIGEDGEDASSPKHVSERAAEGSSDDSVAT